MVLNKAALALAYPLAVCPCVFVPWTLPPFSPLPPLLLQSAAYDCAPIVLGHISRRLVLLFMWEPFPSPSACGRPWTSQMLMLAAMSKQFIMIEHILFPDSSVILVYYTCPIGCF